MEFRAWGLGFRGFGFRDLGFVFWGLGFRGVQVGVFNVLQVADDATGIYSLLKPSSCRHRGSSHIPDC